MTLTDMVLMPGADYQALCDALRKKLGSDGVITSGELETMIESIPAGAELPELENPGDGSKLLQGYQLIGQDGKVVEGTIVGRSAASLTASGATVTVPAGHYPSQVSKSLTTATQATPSISVSGGGLITASATQGAGYVAAGTKTATKQLTVQAAQTITPGTADKTIASGRYLTGTQTIKGDANLKAENIVKGVSIFGVAGAAETGGTELSEMDDLINGSITAITSNATELRDYALHSCDALVTLDLPKATKIGTYAISNCDVLTTINAPNVTSIGTYACYMDMALTKIVMPKLTATANSCFGNCTKLTMADFTATKTIAAASFQNNTKLTALILRGSSVASLASTGAFSGSAIASGTGFIYVPAALMDSYKAATNWSTYADRIRAIEDYPDITGG